jgi:5-methylcytosine-specific restriction enzyme A
MPRSASSPCRYPGCTHLGTGGYCPDHRAERERERPSPSARGYDRRWQAIRTRFMRHHPLCEDCRAEGRVHYAEEVHHVVPLRNGGTHREDNLLSLCKRCHSRRTARGE